MVNTKLLDEIGAKVSEMLSHTPAKDIEKNVKALMAAGFAKMELVTHEEFEVQREVLARTRERLSQLEARIAELEAKQREEAA
ncbi:accessory factor UbiK family protein [Uliginosibacterium sp. H1]|uniref:accessory factor UbiK family protein n=1 Tax=Uliginosibacterium sp. H1 TaxID=3114757 RepID=UPI002E17AAD3|nr:accessory factor UbiK family protein [Uliginosibacterium sp. H1]